MKKKKYILVLVLIVIISSFCFMNNVSADLASEAKEKSCDQLIKEGILDPSNQSLFFDKGNREINCGYMVTYTYYGTGIFNKKKGCAILQLAYNKDGSDLEIESIQLGTENYVYIKKEDWIKRTQLDAQYLANLEGVCPMQIKYTPSGGSHGGNMDEFLFGGNNNMKKIFSTQLKIDIPPLIITDPDYGESKNCKDIIGEDGVSALKTIKNLIIIAIPILLIGLGTLDLVKAIFSNDDGEMKKAQSKLIKRVIIAVIILLAPSVLKVILEIAHKIWPSIDASLCGIYD